MFEKILKLGSLFFTIVLFLYAVIRHNSGLGNSYIYFIIGALGFLIVYFSIAKKKKK